MLVVADQGIGIYLPAGHSVAVQAWLHSMKWIRILSDRQVSESRNQHGKTTCTFY
jgi:hypothetical protein